MKPGARISHQQLLFTVALSQHIAMLLFLPAVMAERARYGSWAAPLIALLFGALPASILVGRLVRYHPGRSFGQIAEQTLGRAAGRLMGLILGGFSLFVTGLIVRDVTDFIPVAMLPETPGWAIGLLFVVVLWYAAYSGPEVIARYAVLTMLLLLGVEIVVPFTVLNHLSLYLAWPVLTDGVSPLFHAAWPALGWFAEVWIFVEFAALLDRADLAVRSLTWGSVIGCLIVCLYTAVSLMMFGPDLVSQFAFPTLSMVQQVALGEFLERLEVALVTLWVAGMVAKGATYLWIANQSLRSALGLSGERHLLLAATACAYALNFGFSSIFDLFALTETVWTPMALALGIGVPSLLLVATWWQRRRQGRQQLGA